MTAECAELSTVPELVSAADVIVLNNVFDWFMPNDAKIKVPVTKFIIDIQRFWFQVLNFEF